MERTREEVSKRRKETVGIVVGLIAVYAIMHWLFVGIVLSGKPLDLSPLTFLNTWPAWIVYGFWPIDLLVIGLVIYFTLKQFEPKADGDTTLSRSEVIAYMGGIVAFALICCFGWFTGLVVTLLFGVILTIVGLIIWYGNRVVEWLILKAAKAVSTAFKAVGRFVARTRVGAKLVGWFQATDVPEQSTADSSNSPAAP